MNVKVIIEIITLSEQHIHLYVTNFECLLQGRFQQNIKIGAGGTHKNHRVAKPFDLTESIPYVYGVPMTE